MKYAVIAGSATHRLRKGTGTISSQWLGVIRPERCVGNGACTRAREGQGHSGTGTYFRYGIVLSPPGHERK
jgi:hypothetical protein